MNKIKKVTIENFWGDKFVTIEFKEDINFLIGVNGSGKTTIINLIAACLKADLSTIDKTQFESVRIDFYPIENKDEQKTPIVQYIEVKKKDKRESPFPNVVFNIKLEKEKKPTTFNLNELEEEIYFRYTKDLYGSKYMNHHGNQIGKDISTELQNYINLTWLSIHRSNRNVFVNDEKSFESSIDMKVRELKSELIKYFGVLDKRYSLETEKFQKNVFLSLIDDENQEDFLNTSYLDSKKEKESLKQIFLLFKLKEYEFSKKLDSHFIGFDNVKKKLDQKKESGILLKELNYILGTRRIHSIVQEWNDLNEKKTQIHSPKVNFIEVINKLYQKKQLYLNEKNELWVRTQSGKEFDLINLSSGEKQLFIILGESLLKENIFHIYIADEPELSLHVDWQEKIVMSLKSVNPNSQIIFATHSPDIVGKYSNRLINIENCIK